MNLDEETKTLKLRHGIFLLIFVWIDVLYLGRIFYFLDFYATALGEALMLVGSLAVVKFAGVRFKPVFQFRRPELKKIFGTVIMWIGSYLFTMMIATIMEFLYPAEMIGATAGLEEGILSVAMLPALLIVSLSPAICEEMVFRGVIFNCVWNKTHKKWATILIVGVIFGAFHGSVWRFVPTCILGIVMGYLLFETNNMFYNMLFHGINNAVPVLLLFATELSSAGLAEEYEGIMQDPATYRAGLLDGMGFYMILGALGLLLLYLGRKLIRYKAKGSGNIQERNRETIITVIVITIILLLMLVGISLLIRRF